jgi:hypothetical protein
VAEGTKGGLLTLMLFLFIIYLCFRNIGRSVKALDKRPTQLIIWALGASLFAHVVGFFGIAYWDQQTIVWYMLLAIISTVTQPFCSGKKLIGNGAR